MQPNEIQAEIYRVIRRVMREPPQSRRQATHARSAGLGVYMAKTSTGGIPAMSTSNVAGTGTVTLYKFSTSNALTAHTGSTGGNITVTAHNIARVSVGASKFIQLKQELLTGKYVVDYEDCSE